MSYSVTDLGAQFDFRSSHLWGINVSGLGAGDAAVSGPPATFHAFLFSEDTATDLGTLGGATSYTRGINASGTVIGYADTAAGFTHAFLYARDHMLDLGTLGGPTSRAEAINSSGEIAGVASTGQANHAVVWSGMTMTDLGTLGGANSNATALNDAGQIAGYSDTSDGFQHAVLWNHGRMTDLGTLAGTDSFAAAINGSGQVVGYSRNADGQKHAVVWTGRTITDLGTLPGYPESEAYGINSSGQIVGDVHPGNSLGHAFIYQEGTMTELTDLLPAGSDITILSARGIDDAGRIVGWGRRPGDGFDHAYLLTPDDASAGLGAVPMIGSISIAPDSQGLSENVTQFSASPSSRSVLEPTFVTLAGPSLGSDTEYLATTTFLQDQAVNLVELAGMGDDVSE
jgi:probable HAF family extracellular repeat protein